ncbi:UDP-glucuronic acid decarboxylase family protein [Microlunatus flavus]|uniref:UDP-glucuronate decarboxylase n=1 Tax=Microlunatus flavus TaxID=1036181 RepID=A0A1H9CY44_9ACTN|nr:UDP-glucuronic acid decarboxylase family protein [Microlunatus flavus]SEQ05513.1 UDP-glucuronate decarboxylase [Microlunatus flavus]
MPDQSAAPARRVLVTGGAGFLGSHLTRLLLSAGHRVTVVDNFSTGTRANLAHLAHLDALTVLDHDIEVPLDLEVDQIYHLACPASPVQYQRDPVRTLKTCVVGSFNVLDLARRTGATVLLASTSEVYGDPAVHPQDEAYWGNVNPMGPRSCYDEGKRCAEAAFFSYREQHGMPVKVARIFNTYGPGMRADDGRVVSNFVVAALHGEPLRVLGDGSQTRSFCYVDDLVDGLVRLMETPEDVTGPINLGNPDEHTVLELAEMVIALAGAPGAHLEHGPLPVDDPTRRCPNIERAQWVLGWKPSTTLGEGLAATVRWFRERAA